MQTLFVLLVLTGTLSASEGTAVLDHAALIDSGIVSDASIQEPGTFADAGATTPPQNPGTPGEAVDQPAPDLGRGSTLTAVLGVLITLLVSALRSPHTGGLIELIPARWRVLVPAVLSLLAGIGAALGGLPAAEAVLIGLFAGPTAVFAHETVAEAGLNHRRSRAPTARLR